MSAQRKLQRASDRQTRALVNLFQGPDRIQEMDGILQRIESGTFKPRVRALEVERAVDRLRAQNSVLLRAVLACTALNAGVVLSFAPAAPAVAASACFAAAVMAGLSAVASALKLAGLEKKEKDLRGA